MLQNTTTQLTTGNDDPLLPKLLHAINHADEIEITVSFIRKSGLAILFDALLDAVIAGAKVRILTSDYMDVTEPVALRELMTLVDRGADVRIYQSEGKQSFHMKAYIFVKLAPNTQTGNILAGCAFIGSNNISKSALTNGFEWSFRHDYHPPNNSQAALQFYEIREAFNRTFAHPNVKLLTHQWIGEYAARRKVMKMVAVDTARNHDDSDLEKPTPRDEQILALSALKTTREQGYQRGLVVLATGMGKTWLSAFDVQQLNAKTVLFVAHREEILIQAQRTYAQLLDLTTGFYNGSNKQPNADCLFASIQTIGRSEHLSQFDKQHFDYIIVDEFHHASAPVYRQLLDYFEPKFLLGLTATPERTDQADILSLCDNNLVFERNLTQGIDLKTLVPFHYFGIWDQDVDYSAIPWRNGRFDPTELTNKFATEKRAKHALAQWQKHKQHRTLAFCISRAHADYMADYFNAAGINALSVHSQSDIRRNQALDQLAQGKIEILFSVDLFNEGTDLPSIDTILMLRPSDSKILFLQQLGRGLRTFKDKSHLVVLDFIGNHHSFLNKPYALIGQSTPSGVVKKIKDPSLPDGCFINYDIEITNFWQQLAKLQRTTATEDVVELQEFLGHTPTLTEFYHHFGDTKKVNLKHNGWFDLIAKSEIDPQACLNAQLLSPFYDFLNKGIQITSMTKCFKAVLLQAFVQLNGFKDAPSVNRLAQQSAKILARYPLLKQHDVPNKEQAASADSTLWLSYWLKNPIKAYTSKNKDGSQWFVLIEGTEKTIKANLDISDEQIGLLNHAVLEISDYCLAKYTKRIQQKQLADITATHAQNNQSIKPSADSHTLVQNTANNKEIQTDSNLIQLPFFPNLKIACGHFKTGDDSEMELKTLPAGFGLSAKDTNTHFLAHASGNSMNGGKNPICDGDLLLLEWITPNNAGSLRDQIVAIERDDIGGEGQYLLRKVNKLPNGQYELIAKNPEYKVLIANEGMRTFARFKRVVINAKNTRISLY